MAQFSLEAVIGADISRLQRAMKKAQSSVRSAARSMESAGRKMTQAITVPLAIAGGAAGKLAADFEASFAKMEGLIGINRKTLEGWKKDVLRISKETGKAPQALAEGLFFVASAGLRGAEAIKALRTSAKASVAGLGSVREVADAATSAMNAYGKENLSASKATDILVATVREGKVQADQLASSMGRVIPTAAELGISFDKVGATMAALTRVGQKSSRAVTALNRMLVTLRKPTDDAKEALADVGMTVGQLTRQFRSGNFVDVLLNLQTKLEGAGRSILDVFGNIRAMRGVLPLISDSADEMRVIFQKLTNTTGATDKAFRAVFKTTKNQFNRALSAGKRLLIEVGDAVNRNLTPVLRSLENLLNRAAEGWKSLSKSTQDTVVQFGIFLATVGPVTLAIGKLGVALFSISSTALIVAGAIAALASAVAFVASNLDPFRVLFEKTFAAIKLGVQKASALVLRAVKSMVGGVGSLLSIFGVDWSDTIKGIEERLSGLRGAMEDTRETMNQSVPEWTGFAESVGNAFDWLTGKVADFLTVSAAAGKQGERAASAVGAATGGGVGRIQPKGPQAKPVALPSPEKVRQVSASAASMASQFGKVSEATHTISDGFKRTIGLTKVFAQQFSMAIGRAVSSMGLLADKLGLVGRVLDQLIGQLITALAKAAILTAIGAVFTSMSGIGGGSFMKRFGSALIPGLAHGGIVTKPTLAMVGEGRESEAVLPLSRLKAMMGGAMGGAALEARISGEDLVFLLERTRGRQAT